MPRRLAPLILLALVAGCVQERSTGFGHDVCALRGAVWEVTEDDLPRTGRWQACSFGVEINGHGLTGNTRLQPVTVAGVDGSAGMLELWFQSRVTEVPVRLPVVGPADARSRTGREGVWVTLLDDEREDLGYVPRGHITVESYAIDEGAEDGSSPSRGSLTLDFTGLTYLHQRRGLTTLNGTIEMSGVEAGCFPPMEGGPGGALLGTFDPSADNACDLPLDLAPRDLPDGTPQPAFLRVAVSPEDFADGLPCGSCVLLFSIEAGIALGGESLRAVVTDECTDCAPSEIRIDPEAFAIVTGGEAEPTNFISARVGCDLPDSISYHFREDSDASRLAVQLRNIRHAVATVEIAGADGEYIPLTRDGSWHVGEGLGPGPFDTRVTDIWGHVLEDLAIELRPGGMVIGGYQFPQCSAGMG